MAALKFDMPWCMCVYVCVCVCVGEDVTCIAQNDACLDGLLTVFHMERSQQASMLNKQNALPLLSEYDKEAIMVRL